MELSEVAAKRPPSATGDGDDRISALPDEVLLIILLFLTNAADAARTSVLSRRWRSVWTLLPDLRVPFFPEPLSFRRALTESQLYLSYLEIKGDGAKAKSLDIWLPAAARRLCRGTLVLVNHAPDPYPDQAETPSPMTWRRRRDKIEDWIQMPCFEKAAKIILDLGFLGVIMPRAGVFAQLSVLILEHVWFYGTAQLIDLFSAPRCPCLQVLKIRKTRGLTDLVINSESLLELELSNLGSLWELTVEATVLKELIVVNCFINKSDLIVSTISAPQLVFLYWRDPPGQCSVKFGPMPHLRSIGLLSYFVYGIQGVPNGTRDNSACIKILQSVKAIKSLALLLAYMRELGDFQYMMENMNVIPNPAILRLHVMASGHSFGASSLHVLRMCLRIEKLVLVLPDNVMAEAQTPCLPGCVCDEQPNWKAEELLLINLQEIEIQLLRGSEHEVSFVKRLLTWATALKKMTVTLCPSTTESNAKELFQLFESLTKPGVCMEFHVL